MEKLLYQKVFEKGVGMKSASTLGQLSSFIAKDIEDICKYIINPKTLIRGFRIYVESEILSKYRSSHSYFNYSPHVDTLKILSIYMGYESFSDFCQKNKVVEKEEFEQPKQKNNITVYQENNGKVFGDVNVKESIIFNLKNNV